MAENNHNLKRIKSLKLARQSKVDQETQSLQKIQVLKRQMVSELRNNQSKYMEGIESINMNRINGNLSLADSLEDSLTFMREKWHENLRKVKNIEKDEVHQVQRVIEAQKDLKMIEKLEEKYWEAEKSLTSKKDQKIMDDIGRRLHTK